MTPLKRSAAGMAAAVLLASGAACSKDEPVATPTTGPPATSVTPSPTASVTPSVTPTPKPTLSQGVQAEADAIAVVKKYYALSDKLAANPPTVTEAKRQLERVATSKQLAYRIFVIGQFHSKQERQTGATAIDIPRVEGVDITFKPKATPPQLPTVNVKVCRDVTDLELFDAAGKSLSNPNRQMRRVSHAEVVNIAWPNPAGWRVRDVVDRATPC